MLHSELFYTFEPLDGFFSKGKMATSSGGIWYLIMLMTLTPTEKDRTAEYAPEKEWFPSRRC